MELIKRSYNDGFCDKKGKRAKHHPSGLNWQMILAISGRTPLNPPSLQTVALLRVDKRKGLMFVTMGGNIGSCSTVAASVVIHGIVLPPREEEWRFEGNIVTDPSALSDAPHSLLGWLTIIADLIRSHPR